MARTYHGGKKSSPLMVVAVAVIAISLAHGAAGGASATTVSAVSGATSSGANVTLGQTMAAQRGWTGAQFTCLNQLWTQESGWNAYAANPTSNARGIPQNINGWSAYAPGDATGQIAWGLSYISSRYGTPCAAEDHERNFNWY
jgi:hypothetical protein